MWQGFFLFGQELPDTDGVLQRGSDVDGDSLVQSANFFNDFLLHGYDCVVHCKTPFGSHFASQSFQDRDSFGGWMYRPPGIG